MRQLELFPRPRKKGTIMYAPDIEILKVCIRRTALLANNVRDPALKEAFQGLGALQIQILDHVFQNTRRKISRDIEFTTLMAAMAEEQNKAIVYDLGVSPDTILSIRKKYNQDRPVGRPLKRANRKATG